MNKSDQIDKICKSLALFQSKMPPVAFDANNPFFKSRYATLSAIVKASQDHLSSCGLAVTQLLHNNCGVETVLLHESGQWISSMFELTPAKNDPQGLGSAVTYARRYAYGAILGIVTDEDDDGNHSSLKNQKPVRLANFGSERKQVIDIKSKEGGDKVPDEELRKRVTKMLLEIHEGNKEAAKEALVNFSSFKKDGEWVIGKNTTVELEGPWLRSTYGKIKTEYQSLRKEAS